MTEDLAEPREMVDLTRDQSDSVFIAFASPEKRCLGVATRFKGYLPRKVCLLRIDDEPNELREENIREFRELVGCDVEDVAMQHSDVVFGIDVLVKIVAGACDASGDVTVDISTFPKPSLLLVLRALARLANVKRIRVLYTEPASYDKRLLEPLSYGVRRVAVVPTFAAPYRANQDLVLIAFLGYERDRALGMWQSIEPNRTIAIIGKPAYQPEWEGQVESLNAAMLAGMDDQSIEHVDPRNPVATYQLLRSIIGPESGPRENIYIAPLGTKPQTLGLHYFCTEFPETATVAYASPMEHSAEYISQGVGRCWELPRPRGHK